MCTLGSKRLDEEFSEIGDDNTEVGFLDYQEYKSSQIVDPSYHDGPISISNPFPFIDGGKPQSVVIGGTSADEVSITNCTSDPVDLWSVRIFSQNPEDSYVMSLMKPPLVGNDEEANAEFVGFTALEDRVLQPGVTLTLWLSCRPKCLGLHNAIMHFDLGDEKIERVVFLLADDEISQSLSSQSPYVGGPSRGKKKPAFNKYVNGRRPPRSSKSFSSSFRLPEYPIPNEVRETVENKRLPDVIVDGLSFRNYTNYFRTLIIMEEIHMEGEMRRHDMELVAMRKRGNLFLSLEVPGLAEKRPSLVCGDFVVACHANSERGTNIPHYQGFIHRVEADEILLKFDERFHVLHRADNLYNVTFSYNRVNMRRLYHAIHEAEGVGRALLFPHQACNKRVIKTSSFIPLHPYLNKEQARSVEMVLGCKGMPPYLIHGPPGTGKTMTLIEAILQLYFTRPNSQILACAASNSSADHLLEKLLDKEGVLCKEGFVVNDSDIFRLNASSRSYDDIKPDFLSFCFFDDMIFTCPPFKALLRYRIIISTYMSASLLYAEGIKRGHFSHICLDEAGQASEPETMVPISNLCASDTVIVLAGDPMQLGPVIHSLDAEKYGLGKSYMERLYECKFYECGDENYVTKLVKNYRCHPAILELPSRLFYKSELIPCKQVNVSSIYDWEELPNKEFPVLFIGIQGCDEREGNNPSWFNRIEASKVIDIIKKLMSNTELSEEDIGVITPYRQQVLKVKKALEMLEMPSVKVGSVEQFQGQERQIIIITTVRSTIKHNEFDRMHNLGFLCNPRRFNVSTTRAKALLIIIGNPHIISEDPYWNKLLRYCADNGSYVGCPLPILEEQSPNDDDYNVEGNQHTDNAAWSNDGSNTEWGNASSQPDPLEVKPEGGHNQWSGSSGWDDDPSSWTNTGWTDGNSGKDNQWSGGGSGWDDDPSSWTDGNSVKDNFGNVRDDYGSNMNSADHSDGFGWNDNSSRYSYKADSVGAFKGKSRSGPKPSNFGWDD